jgi:hypothetical protein
VPPGRTRAVRRGLLVGHQAADPAVADLEVVDLGVVDLGVVDLGVVAGHPGADLAVARLSSSRPRSRSARSAIG